MEQAVSFYRSVENVLTVLEPQAQRLSLHLLNGCVFHCGF